MTVAESTNPGRLPALPLTEWLETKETLHRFFQVVGKIRMADMPHQNHWWHVTLALSTRGVTTGPVPHGLGAYTIEFDFIEHQLLISTSSGEIRSFGLAGPSVSVFYRTLFGYLAELGIHPRILAQCYELTPALPFADDQHRTYDPAYVHRFWQIALWVDGVFEEYRGRFTGKQSPVNLFWHGMDMAVARFSGRRAPDRPGANISDREAYSHEVIAVGFSVGDANSPTPAFYSYTAPEPNGFAEESLKPDAAFWADLGTSHMGTLQYDAVRGLLDPRAALLEFCESAYLAGAKRAGWDIAGFRTVTFPTESVPSQQSVAPTPGQADHRC